jgi:TetR/AcrR family transcriptional regulator, cholesterol catabolism regulator
MISAREAAFEFKKDLILKVAAENFFKKGYTKTKIDDITSALKVTKPYVYYHFSSKLEILEEICGRTSVFAANLAESAAKQAAGSSVVERLRTFVRNFSLTVIEERMFLSIYFRESKHLPKRTQDRFRNDRRRFHAALSRILTEGRDSGHFSFADLSVTEQTVTGMITWIFNWYQADGKKSAEEVCGFMEDLVLSAVGVAIARHETAAERGRMTADAECK